MRTESYPRNTGYILSAACYRVIKGNNLEEVCTLLSVLLVFVLDATNFGVGVGEARPEGPRAGVGLWGGAASPYPPAWGLWERCKLPQRGSGHSPDRRRIFLYCVPSDCLSSMQFAWLGIRFF